MPQIHNAEFAQQGSTPSNPASGNRKIYPKSDGWYELDSSGTESQIGGGTELSSSELTIATGAVTKTGAFHTIDTEGDAASDDLATISGGTSGDILFISAENDARTVIVKHGTGNIVTLNGQDINLANIGHYLVLEYDGTNWNQLTPATVGLLLSSDNDINIDAGGYHQLSIYGGSGDFVEPGIRTDITENASDIYYSIGLDLNSLGVAAAVDGAADYAVIYDASAAAHKKVLLNNLPGGGGGGSSPLTTKGDIYTYSTVDARLPVGTDGQILSADSAEATGLKWIANSGGGGGTFSKTTATRRTETVLWEKTLSTDGTFDTNSADDLGNSGALATGYDFLVVEYILRSDNAANNDNMRLEFNNDTTDTNYRYAYQQNSTARTTGDLAIVALIEGNTSTANYFSSGRIELVNSSDSTSNLKAYANQWLRDGDFVRYQYLMWENTAEVTRIASSPNTGTNYKTGSMFRVIGVKRETIVTDVTSGAMETSDANVSSPPTDAELDSAFGTPATVGDGFLGLVDDAGGDTAVYLVASNGTSWWYTSMTKAV